VDADMSSQSRKVASTWIRREPEHQCMLHISSIFEHFLLGHQIKLDWKVEMMNNEYLGSTFAS